MRRFLAYLLAIALAVALTVSTANSAVTPGSKCSKAGTKQLYKGKLFTCIKLGKKLYWNNGVLQTSVKPSTQPSTQPLPTTKAQLEEFTFYVQHTLVKGGGNDELLKVTIDSNNKILNSKVMLKADLQSYYDSLKGVMLFKAGSSGNFYLLDSSGNQTPLSVKEESGIPSDSRRLWLEPRFYGSTNEILFWDFDSDMYRVSNISLTPLWEKAIDGKTLKSKFAQLGLDAEREWLDDFVVVDKNNFVLATSNSTTKTINLWRVSYRGLNDFTLSQISQFKFQGLSASFEMVISPDKSNVAYKYSASELTPNFRVVLMNVSTGVRKEIATSRFYEGFIGPLVFLDNNNLLAIPALTWNSDPNGGRVVCRLDLRLEQNCLNISGVAGLDVQGLTG
jgi:hypothetical protein